MYRMHDPFLSKSLATDSVFRCLYTEKYFSCMRDVYSLGCVLRDRKKRVRNARMSTAKLKSNRHFHTVRAVRPFSTQYFHHFSRTKGHTWIYTTHSRPQPLQRTASTKRNDVETNTFTMWTQHIAVNRTRCDEIFGQKDDMHTKNGDNCVVSKHFSIDII